MLSKTKYIAELGQGNYWCGAGIGGDLDDARSYETEGKLAHDIISYYCQWFSMGKIPEYKVIQIEEIVTREIKKL